RLFLDQLRHLDDAAALGARRLLAGQIGAELHRCIAERTGEIDLGLRLLRRRGSQLFGEPGRRQALDIDRRGNGQPFLASRAGPLLAGEFVLDVEGLLAVRTLEADGHVRLGCEKGARGPVLFIMIGSALKTRVRSLLPRRARRGDRPHPGSSPHALIAASGGRPLLPSSPLRCHAPPVPKSNGCPPSPVTRPPASATRMCPAAMSQSWNAS